MGDPEYQFTSSSYSFPQHCMPPGSPLEQGCYLIFSISNKHTQESVSQARISPSNISFFKFL